MDIITINNCDIDPSLSDLNVRLIVEIKARVWWYCYIADIGANLNLQRPELCFQGNISCIVPSRDTIWTLEEYDMSSFDCYQTTVMGYTSNDKLNSPSYTESHIWKEVILV